MKATFKLSTNDLDTRFIESLKQLFLNQDIFITVVSAKQKQNKYSKKILKAIQDREDGKLNTLNP